MSDKVLAVTRIHAKHDKATEFNTELEMMAEKRKCVVGFLGTEFKRESSGLTMVYTYAVVDAKQEPFLPESVKNAEPIRVVRTWVNKERFMYLSLLFGVKAPDVPDRTVSHIYYRINGLLVKAEGAGRDLLHTNIQISDEEWANLRSGCPDDKLLKRA